MALFKKYITKYLPKPEEMNSSRFKFLHKYILKPEYWHFNRKNIRKGVAAGLFIAFVPLPGQMLMGVIAAILLRANMPIAVMMTWISNPFTFIPLNIFIYQIGAWVSGSNGGAVVIQEFSFKSLHWNNLWQTFVTWIQNLGEPFLIGLPIIAVVTSLVGYFLVNQLWRCTIKIRWQKRKKLELK